MSHSRFSYRRSRTEDHLSWQNDMGNYSNLSNPSPSHTPGLDAAGIASPLPGIAHWPRDRRGSDYTAVDSSTDVSMKENDNKTIPLVSVELKPFRSYTDIFPPAPDFIVSSNGEVPKVAIKRGLRDNWTKLAPHVLAICVTAAVCQLSFRNVYWMDLQSPEKHIAFGLTQGGALNFLQLAAKLHELLILASITSLVLHVIQAHLTGPSGLPFGMVANAFELGSGRFLRRMSFWTSIFSIDPATGKRFPFAGFWLISLFATLLATLSGPASAISVIPTLNYFDLPRPFNQSVLPYYVFNESTELWPTQLTAASLNAPNSGILCNDPDSESDQDICPAGGFGETYNWGGGLLFQNSDEGSNISFPDSLGDTRRVLTTQSCNADFDGRASGISINAFVSSALTAYWTFAQQNFHGPALEAARPRISLDWETELFAPRVEIMCNSYANYYFDPENPDNQTSMNFPTFDNSTVVPVPDWTYKYSRPVNASNFTFVEIPNTSPPLTYLPSLGAVLTLPLIEQINGTWVQATENLACSIFSQWIPISAWYEPTINDQVSYSITGDMSNTCLDIPSSPNSEREAINTSIDMDYANAINQPLVFLTGEIPALEAIYERFIFNDSTYIPNGVIFKAPIPGINGVVVTDDVARKMRAKLVSTVLAGVVTDGLARNAGNGAFPYSSSMFLLQNRTADGGFQGRFPVTSATGGEDDPLNTTDPNAIKTWLKINPTFQRYGYGYRWQGSRTTQFGISVLLLHMAVAITHTVFVLSELLGTNGGIQRSWETIPEMFALLLNSRPSERFQNTCAGIEEDWTWHEKVGVRETSNGHLEMVVGRGEMQQFVPPRVGIAYGTLPGGEETGRRSGYVFDTP